MLKTFEAHCPRCNGERTCYIHGEVDTPWSWSDGKHEQWGQSDFKLAQCCGCKEVFFHKSSWDSEDWDIGYNAAGEEVYSNTITITTYPVPEKKSEKPDWVWKIAKIDPQLFSILNEMYQAYEHGSFILAAIGLRTAFDRTTEIFKIHPSLPLEEKVKRLREEGFIGETESQTLGVVIDAGSAAAHRAWSPAHPEFQTLLTTLEQFIYRTVVSGKDVLSIAHKIPAKPPRPPKAPKPITK